MVIQTVFTQIAGTKTSMN